MLKKKKTCSLFVFNAEEVSPSALLLQPGMQDQMVCKRRFLKGQLPGFTHFTEWHHYFFAFLIDLTAF